MKKRLLTAAVGIAAATAWLFAMYTPVFVTVLAIVAFIAEYEMLKVFGVKNIPFQIICLAISAAVVFCLEHIESINIPLFPIITAVVILSLIIMVLDFERLRFEQVVCSLLSAVLIPSALSCVILFRDVYKSFDGIYNKNDGIFFILFAFICSWATDSFALFAGMAFGKHKLSPKISPKKTVEGAVGGVLGCMLVCTGLYFLFKLKLGLSESITLTITLISALLLSVISIFGDLAASTIKRHHGVKDFGNILPGHGGVMDRFDSSVFVFPVLYSIIVVMNQLF